MMISSSHPLSVVAMFHHYDEVVVVVVVVALCRHRRRGDDVASGCVCVPHGRDRAVGGTHTPLNVATPNAHATQRGVDVAHRA